MLQTQGKLTEAQAAFEEALAINRRLAEKDPTNTGWQSELAATLNWLGGVLQTRAGCRRRWQRLRRPWRSTGGWPKDPSNAGWQSELAATLTVGGVLRTQGNDGAQAAFKENLAIRRRLATRDLTNAGWQSGLAATLNRLGGVLETQGKLTEARRRLRRPWRSTGGWPSKTRPTPAGNRSWGRR